MGSTIQSAYPAANGVVFVTDDGTRFRVVGWAVTVDSETGDGTRVEPLVIGSGSLVGLASDVAGVPPWSGSIEFDD